VSDELICTYKYGTFYLVNILDETIAYLASINISAIERNLSKVNFLSRLLRTGVRYGKLISANEVLFVLNKTIYNLNIETKLIRAEHSLEKGNRPLSMARIQDIDGFENGVYYGEYFSNPRKAKVNIFQRDNDGNWHVAGFFPKGTINHIHALVPDHFRKCVWILTGDFDTAAGIWVSKNGFDTIEPVLTGEQKYRACVAFPSENGLLYATDTPFCQNAIQFLAKSDNKWISKRIVEIDGPAVYGCKLKNNFVFSTSVEGNGTEQGLKLKTLLERKRGKGVKSASSHIYLGNLEMGFEKVYGDKKDFLPFNLFQFGSILFPEGENKTNTLAFYPIALRNCDLTLRTMKMNIELSNHGN
jgi:hypothetical protein